MRCACGRIRMSFSSITTCKSDVELVSRRLVCEAPFLPKIEKNA